MGCMIAALVAAAGATSIASSTVSPPTLLNEVQWTYLERCGGCHGIQGASAPSQVPSLRGQVGYFLCMPEARAYLIRLPSVATSPLSDRELADLMNFVVFDLGGAAGAPREYDKFTETEVHDLRQRPLKDAALTKYRAGLVEQLITRCNAPATLRQYSALQGQ
jgi:hypothetical protein